MTWHSLALGCKNVKYLTCGLNLIKAQAEFRGIIKPVEAGYVLIIDGKMRPVISY